jgi:hypothetical protein
LMELIMMALDKASAELKSRRRCDEPRRSRSWWS